MNEPPPLTAPSAEVGILVALPAELRVVRRLVRSGSTLRSGGLSITLGSIGATRVAVAATGMGSERAADATAAFIEGLRPATILACGFAGGAAPSVLCGDVVAADSLVELSPAAAVGASPRPIAAAGALRMETRLVEAACRAARQASLRIERGPLGCARRVLGTSAEKAHAHAAAGVLAVDMESIGSARAAAAAGVPILCARVVVDDARTELPLDFDRAMRPDGRPRIASLVAAIARRPRVLVALAALGARSRRAGAALAAFVAAVVPELGASGPE